MDREHLHLLINEEIYAIPDSIREEASGPVEENEASLPQETDSVQEEITIHVSQEELDHEHHDETPKIPDVHHDESDSEPARISFAVFHESSNPEELDLLQKIIGACDLDPDQYQVFANGFNKEVKFEKALVFVPQAKAFYQPIPYKESQFLCSRPLSVLVTNQQEKAMLWGALKKFL